MPCLPRLYLVTTVSLRASSIIEICRNPSVQNSIKSTDESLVLIISSEYSMLSAFLCIKISIRRPSTRKVIAFCHSSLGMHSITVSLYIWMKKSAKADEYILNQVCTVMCGTETLLQCILIAPSLNVYLVPNIRGDSRILWMLEWQSSTKTLTPQH